MNIFKYLLCRSPEITPRATPEEIEFVRQFGAVRKVRYVNNPSMTNLVILGSVSGIRVETTPNGRRLRRLEVRKNGTVVPTTETRILRMKNGRFVNINPRNLVY